MGWILNFVYMLALTLASPWLIWRSLRTGRYREGWREKLFGFVPARQGVAPCIWLHAVSVGEVQLLRTLVEQLESARPNVDFVITTTTKTGMELARKLFARHKVFYCPFDFTWAVRNALRRIRPQLLVLVELELWPNLIRMADSSGCPVAIVNGRLSESSFTGYRRIVWLTRNVLKRVSWIGAQDETYRGRFIELGAPRQCVVVSGSLKFDGAETNRQHSEIVRRQKELGLSGSERIWVVGSTQEPEEQFALDAFVVLADRFPDLRMIVVPRHPERFEQVARIIRDSQIAWIRRSQMSGVPIDHSWRILLGDTMGELRWWWGLAEIALVGGSFGDRGGQNMIEPAAFGVATSFGPNTRNFRDIVSVLIDAEAVHVLNASSEIVGWVAKMLENQDAAANMGRRASQLVGRHRGATQMTVEHLIQLGAIPDTKSRAA